jgi:hypothetical protein
MSILLKQFGIPLLIVCLMTVVTVSCEPQTAVEPGVSETSARKGVASLKILAAKTLAKAVYDESVRELIKKEALKRFDGDYDVLFQMVKDRKTKDGKTLQEYFSSFDDSPQRFRGITEDLPLLTIFVPTFFSAEKWNTATQIPIVAVRDEENRLMAFNKDGESVELSPTEEPNIPILVVKLNDRVTIKSPGSKSVGGRLSAENFIFNNGRHNFYFIDASMNNITPRVKGARNIVGTLDPVVMEAYNRCAGVNYNYQRDWIYYGINPASGQNRGPLNLKFKEAITQIEFANIGAFDYMGGWDEGGFVLFFNGFFGSRTQPTKVAPEKVIAVRAEDLFTYHEETRHRFGPCLFWYCSYTVRVVDGVKPYDIGPQVTYESWNMEEYGDKWTLKIEEFDALVERTGTFTDTSKFGYNFSINAGTGTVDKIGASLGISGGFEKSTTNTYKTTDANDDLGVVTLSYTDPVVVDFTNAQIFGITIPFTRTYETSTGTVKVSFETVRVAP